MTAKPNDLRAVPVGEPPTPEGWPKTIWFCEQCGEQPGAVNLPCACVDWGKRIKVQAFRVAPVGGAGQEVEKVIANMRAFAKGQEEIADPKHDSAYHLRTSYISYFRSLADQLERAAPVGGAGQEHGDDDSLASARGLTDAERIGEVVDGAYHKLWAVGRRHVEDSSLSVFSGWNSALVAFRAAVFGELGLAPPAESEYAEESRAYWKAKLAAGELEDKRPRE